MSLTTLDPRPALIVIDLQKGILSFPTVHPAADIIERSASLARAFRLLALPVVLVNVTGRAPGRTEAPSPAIPADPEWAELVPELQAQPEDKRITKQTWGAFHDTGLHAYLHDKGITQVVITGIATSAGVESTARAAHEHGYNVVVVTDATTDRSMDAYQNSLANVFPRLSETATTEEVLHKLAHRPQ